MDGFLLADDPDWERENLQSQLLHADTDNAPHDGSHAQRWDVEAGRYFDADREDGDDNLKDEGQRQEPEGAVHSRTRRSTLHSKGTSADGPGEIPAVITV